MNYYIGFMVFISLILAQCVGYNTGYNDGTADEKCREKSTHEEQAQCWFERTGRRGI